MLSEEVKGRLLNWKFEQAWEALVRDRDGGYVGITEQEEETVRALYLMLGNCGWMDGVLADVVRAAVWYCGVFDPADEPHGAGR